jgi:hypothetical protein
MSCKILFPETFLPAILKSPILQAKKQQQQKTRDGNIV